MNLLNVMNRKVIFKTASSAGVLPWVLMALLFSACTSRFNGSQIPEAQGTPGTTMPAGAVLTQHNDNFRSGADTTEQILNTTNVNTTTFGMLFSRTVDGQIYAQLLYVPAVNMPGVGTKNVVIAATMHNSVYAFDADNAGNTTPFWSVNLGPSIPNSVIGSSYQDINPEIGILSTPVIDPQTNTIYVEAATYANGVHTQKLHALDLTTGTEKFGGPVVIGATFPGTASDGNGTQITFTPNMHMQRSALTLTSGNVYVTFASHGDYTPYHGWIMSYNAATLALNGVYSTTPNSGGGGIWQSGQGLAVDATGDIYFSSGNGFSSDATKTTERVESVVKLSPNLTLLDWFTPYDWSNLDSQDLDLGSSGVLVIPGTSYLLPGSKAGKIYLMSQSSLGKITTNDTQIQQVFQATVSSAPSTTGECHIHGTPIFWSGPTGSFIYVWGENDYLKAYQFSGTQFNATATSHSAMTAPVPGMPGGFLSVSSNGAQAGTGIVWANVPYSGNANPATVPGILRAFDATNLSKELWDSQQNATRDSFGNFAKFAPPTVANGKVYLPTFSDKFVVYGLLGQ